MSAQTEEVDILGDGSFADLFGGGSEHGRFELDIRDPCPIRIVSDLGGAFAMGSLGGFLWHAIKGAKNSPRGERWRGAGAAVRVRAPQLGGNFAVWGGLYSTFDCALAGLRQKDDAWNSIGSGAITGAVLAAKGGLASSGRAAVVGGMLLGIIEGIAYLFQHFGESWGSNMLGLPPPPGPFLPPVEMRRPKVDAKSKAAKAGKDEGSLGAKRGQEVEGEESVITRPSGGLQDALPTPAPARTQRDFEEAESDEVAGASKERGVRVIQRTRPIKEEFNPDEYFGEQATTRRQQRGPQNTENSAAAGGRR